jgi:predicted nucleic acid-binding protein
LSWGWVVDASVGIKLYLPEDLKRAAEDLFQGLEENRTSLFVPDLFYTECANILWKNVRRSKVSADHARKSLRNLNSLNLLPISSGDLLLSSLDLALEHGITAYDASYIALARELELPLVTADHKLIDKLDGQAAEVLWLGDLVV